MIYDNETGMVKTRPRVLVVDNDVKVVLSYQELLKFFGYEPILATGFGKDLIKDAKDKAREHRCSLALIDLRLTDDYDKNDNSGLLLASEFGDEIRSVILSGYGDPDFLREILQNHRDINFISKGDTPETIKRVLDAEAKKINASSRKIKFEGLDIMHEIINSPLGLLAGGYVDQIADVLARLFPDAKNMRLERLGSTSLSPNVSTVPRPNSIILKVYEDDYEPYIVKFARSEKIRKEIENYNKYISRRSTEHFTARLVRNAILWDIGGASYSYVGSFNVQTFTRFYEEKPISDIEESLRSFFGVTWTRHYEQAHVEKNVSLFDLYTKVWGDWYKKCRKAFPVIDPVGMNVVHDVINPPDPVEWIKKNIVESSNNISLLTQTRVAITHGDLHGDNLLIDSKKIAWVIDFERCGQGHVLQDFIELESDIINRIEAQNENSSDFLRMFLVVLKKKQICGFSDAEIVEFTNNARVKKAMQTISIIRDMAALYTGIGNSREYLIGLLFNTLFRATIVKNKFPQDNHFRILMVASIICHRLDYWDMPWPPQNWEKYLGL